MLDELKTPVTALGEKIRELGASLDVAKKEATVAELEYKSAAPDFWNDTDKATELNRQLGELRNFVDFYHSLTARADDLHALWELAKENPGEIDESEIRAELSALQHDLRRLELDTLLSGEYDANNAYLELHAGAGGTEAQDWNQMLLRMYTRWASQHGFAVDTIDLQPGDEAGVKSVTLFVRGHNAYGYLKSEKGVHRLVRISPFDANARRHTSFCSCTVMPELADAQEVEIDMTEVKVDTYRASGAGGQHVNKTSSAVRMTHLPTNTVVQCQNERSQIQNRETCLHMLKAKLFALELAKKEQEKAKLMGVQMKNEWGSQIRSYVFQPYTMVKDHRTGVETANVQAVMDGELDKFIEGYLASLTLKATA